YSGSLTLSPREERGVKSKTNVVRMLVSLCVLAILLGFFFCMGIQARCPFRNLATSFHSSGQFAGFMGFSGYCYGDRSHSGYNIMDATNAILIRRDCFFDRSPARSTGGIGSCAFHSTGSGVPLPADSPSRRQGQSHQSSNCCRIPL